MSLREIWKSILVAACTLTLLSCGEDGPGSDDLKVAVTPTRSFILPGMAPSCVDLAENTGATSVAPERISFPQFRLEWSAQKDLYVYVVRVKFKSAQIAGGEYKCEISSNELATLIGRAGAHLTKSSTSIIIRSNVAADKEAPYDVACSLNCGSITLVENARSFTARAKVEVLGYSVASDGTQTPERAFAEADIEYIQ